MSKTVSTKISVLRINLLAKPFSDQTKRHTLTRTGDWIRVKDNQVQEHMQLSQTLAAITERLRSSRKDLENLAAKSLLGTDLRTNI